MRNFILLICLGMCGMAYAGKPAPHHVNLGPVPNLTVNNSVKQNVSTESSASAESSQSQSATASNDGNSQSVNTYTPRNAPSAFSGGTNTTAECYTSVGGGISSTVGGISFGLGRKVKDCAKFILAQDLYSRGLNDAGDRMYCSITEMREILGPDCVATVAAQHFKPEPQAPAPVLTTEQVDRIIKKGLMK